MSNSKTGEDDNDDAATAIPSKFQVWKLACRPHTLTASITPVLVGYALTLRLMREHPDVVFDSRHHHRHDYDSSSDAIDDATTIGTTPSLAMISLQFGIFASLIQISTNLHNDYADYVRGADTPDRVGQARATQRGWLTPHETCRGCLLCLCLAFCAGARLCLVRGIAAAPSPSHPDGGDDGVDDGRHRCGALDGSAAVGGYYRCDPLMAFVVISSMFNAVAYTGGPFPLGCIGLGELSIGYSGLGDVFVFVYFGIVATLGVPYLYLVRSIATITPSSACLSSSSHAYATTTHGGGGIIPWNMLSPSLLHSLPVGFLATAIIVVNNLRDRHTDVYAGKRTMAVRFGEKFARVEYLVLVLGSYSFCVVSYCYQRRHAWWWSSSTTTTTITTSRPMTNMAWAALLPLLSLPIALPQLRAVAFGGKDGMALNDHVGGTARLQMIYCVLMAMGLAISSR
ncbi:hypothetical protein ACHAXA_010447 [Cyclostephanos tholiformis]|uniref:1,4-dihydroxy-2-naphthoate octaprenyltransferase n=1 Tax=Cyclostephanos tholiformis TaxID=382380 RepID=A0ABD3SG80_9STRA